MSCVSVWQTQTDTFVLFLLVRIKKGYLNYEWILIFNNNN